MSDKMKKLSEEDLNAAAGGFSTNLTQLQLWDLKDELAAAEELISAGNRSKYHSNFNSLYFTLENACQGASYYNSSVIAFTRLIDGLLEDDEKTARDAVIEVYRKFEEWS